MLRTPSFLFLLWAASTLSVHCAGFGQPASRLEFEVASIRPTASDPSQQRRAGNVPRFGKYITGARVEYIFMTLPQLIGEAYQVNTSQLNDSDRLSDQRFDLVCKMPPGARKEDVTLMLQSLLADRFKLVVHREMKEQRISALVIDKDGPKLKESLSKGSPSSPGRAAGSGFWMSDSFIRSQFIPPTGTPTWVHMEATMMTMQVLAHLLRRSDAGDGRIVVDMTGLKGHYDVALDIPWSRIGGFAETGAPEANTPPAETASDPGIGSVHQSLRKLGLKLENRTVRVEQLIIDHAEKTPTEN